tara:strand:+ start:2396 stop:3673 length:1278 start_codon:yes stop_codon:yes gene_type:complete
MKIMRKKANIKVYGDIMLDRWIIGKFNKKSQEAPINIFSQLSKKINLGGVGNLAENLKNLNINFKLFSNIGKDEDGKIIIKLLKKKKILFELKRINNPTTIKNRFLDQYHKHFFRYDFEKKIKSNNVEKFFHNKVLKNDLIVISDYEKGCIKKDTINKLVKKDCKIFVDPKSHPNFYKNVFFIKPNMEKYNEWFGIFSKKKAIKIMKKMNWQWLVVTDGHKGVHVLNKNGIYNFLNSKKISNPDVTGAGDIFFSIIIYLFLNNYDIFTASTMANNICSKLVAKRGMQIVKKDNFFFDTVFINGVFDILHPGHNKLFKFAKSISKKIIVGINSDKSVKNIKGNTRPYNNLKIRIKNLKKIKTISEIHIFKSKTPLKLIKKIKPDVIIKGDDYNFKNIVGRSISNIIIFPRYKNYSSSEIINKLKKN